MKDSHPKGSLQLCAALLWVFLLSGYSQLSAHAYQESTFCFPLKNLSLSEHLSFDTDQTHPILSIESPSPGPYKINHQTESVRAIEEEEEDDKLSSSKKHSASNNHFVTLYNYFFHIIHKDLPSGEFIVHFASSRPLYILLQVFRI